MKINTKSYIIILVVLLLFPFVSFAADAEIKDMEEKIKFDREIVQRIANGENIVYAEDGETLIYLWEDDAEISPQWGSGGSTKVHQWMVSRALAVLENDYGYWITDPFYAGGYIGQMFAGADWPDNNERDNMTFKGHFYNPTTGKNWMGETNPTAFTRFRSWSNIARDSWHLNRELALSYLGRSLHYLSDLSCPHHVHNQIAGLSDHSEFESWADANRNSFRLLNGNKYHIGGSWTTMQANIANGCAYDTYYDSTFVYDPLTQFYILQNWNATADKTLKHGQNYMAAFLYRFLQAVGEI